MYIHIHIHKENICICILYSITTTIFIYYSDFCWCHSNSLGQAAQAQLCRFPGAARVGSEGGYGQAWLGDPSEALEDVRNISPRKPWKTIEHGYFNESKNCDMAD